MLSALHRCCEAVASAESSEGRGQPLHPVAPLQPTPKAATASADAAAVHSALEICAAIAATSAEGRAVMVESGAVPAAITALKVLLASASVPLTQAGGDLYRIAVRLL